MRMNKEALVPLALEALIERLSSKRTCLLELGRQNHQIIKFEVMAEMLNILLETSQLNGMLYLAIV